MAERSIAQGSWNARVEELALPAIAAGRPRAMAPTFCRSLHLFPKGLKEGGPPKRNCDCSFQCSFGFPLQPQTRDSLKNPRAYWWILQGDHSFREQGATYWMANKNSPFDTNAREASLFEIHLGLVARIHNTWRTQPTTKQEPFATHSGKNSLPEWIGQKKSKLVDC